MATKKKKKVRRKPKGTVRKARPRAKPVASGARDVGLRERHFGPVRKRKPVDAAEAQLRADVDELRAAAPSEDALTEENVRTAVDALASMPEPQFEVRRRFQTPMEPEQHTYVPPQAAGSPALPDLTGVTLTFYTSRRGTWCDVAYALLPDASVVIRRTHDKLDGGSTYMLTGSADLDEHQYGGEIGSHHWYEATDEQHEAIAACDRDEPPQPFEQAIRGAS
jgi:hypothetical protein